MIMVNLVFVFFNNVYVAIEKARGNGGRILGVNLLMAAAKFTLSGVFVLIFRQGVVMIAFSTLLSNLLVTLIGIYSLRDQRMYSGYHWNISEWTVCLSKSCLVFLSL